MRSSFEQGEIVKINNGNHFGEQLLISDLSISTKVYSSELTNNIRSF